MRFVVPAVATSSLTVVIVAAVSIIAVLLETQDADLQQLQSPGQRGDYAAQPKPVDATVLMQGTRIQLDRLSLQDTEKAQENSDTHAPPAQPRRRSEDKAMIATFGSQGVHAHAFGEIGMAAKSLRVKLWNAYMLSSIQLTRSTGTFMVVMIVILIGCTCLAAWSMVFPDKFGLDPKKDPYNFSAFTPESSKESVTSLPAQQQRYSQEGTMGVSQSSPLMFTSQGPPQRNLINTSLTSPQIGALAPSPLMSGVNLSGQLMNRGSTSPRPVPPLCPTIVMPMVEARFGIPLLEINKLMKFGAGELVVVGLSTNPLLRAVVKRVGNSRSLEIAMPEKNGVPRATLTPSAGGSHVPAGATALEIRGMRGSFYGYLVMTESATYVTNDGQTVLSIGGEAASLQLLLKSSAGNKVADVRCSSEAFGGSDHVELRVEPGVDTVLVLAVVLAVLLLSPWSQTPR